MCGKVISGADYEQINSFGGGIFQTGSKFFITNRIAGTQKRPRHRCRGRSRFATRTDFERIPERFSNESPNGFRTNLLTARRPNGFRTIRSDRFRTVVRTYFGRLPEGVSDCHSEGFRPTVRTNPGPLPGGISGRHPGQISGRRTDSEPPSVRTTTRTHRRPGNRTEKRAHSRRRNVRPQPPYRNKRFSSAANLYPAFSTCASANSYEKMMKSRDSSYESV